MHAWLPMTTQMLLLLPLVVLGYFFKCARFSFPFLSFFGVCKRYFMPGITDGIYSEHVKNHPVQQGSDYSLLWMLLCSWSLNIYPSWVSMKNGPCAQLIIIWLYVASLAHNMHIISEGVTFIFWSLLHFSRDVIAKPSPNDVTSKAYT